MRVGSDVESVCRKCGRVWHVVVAMADGGIAQVECRDCGARHRYRPVDGEDSKPARARRSSAATGASRARSRRKRAIVEADPSRPRRPFSPSETYAVGDRVVHASFGEGVVQALRGATKIEILFEVGPKTLVHGRGRD